MMNKYRYDLTNSLNYNLLLIRYHFLVLAIISLPIYNFQTFVYSFRLPMKMIHTYLILSYQSNIFIIKRTLIRLVITVFISYDNIFNMMNKSLGHLSTVGLKLKSYIEQLIRYHHECYTQPELRLAAICFFFIFLQKTNL